MSAPLRVGIVGAGPVTQAIHVPTLAALSDEFRIGHIADLDLDLARRVAAGPGARASESAAEVIEDPDIDVIAICSPSHVHAEHLEMVSNAGKRAVLCEKPLAMAMRDVDKAARALRASRTPLVLGAMHGWDPAWQWAKPRVEAFGPPHTVRSSIILPRNVRFEDASSEIVGRPARPGVTDDSVEARVRFVQDMVLGLTVHHVPQVRAFAPQIVSVDAVHVVGRTGYVILASGNEVSIVLTAYMNDGWRPDWGVRAVGDDRSFAIDFPPSFVHAGSGSATYVDASGAVVSPSSESNGYLEEWRRVGQLARGERDFSNDLEDSIADALYAVDLAEMATTWLREHA